MFSQKGIVRSLFTRLWLSRGYFPRDELLTFDKIRSPAAGPSRHGQPTWYRHLSTGSLGQGILAALGMALGAKLLRKQDIRVYCMVGDGECQEGEVWEAAHVATRYGLDNLIVLVDFNKVQQYGWPGSTTEERAPTWGKEQLPAIWSAFGWQVAEIDGHNLDQILGSLSSARNRVGTGMPSCIIAHTIKGKGVSFMENTINWHARVPSANELEAALAELQDGGRIHG